MFFLNHDTGYVVGDTGKVYKPTTGGVVGIPPLSNEIPKNFELFQNYPNPFNPATKIKYQIPNSSFVLLEVNDVLGKLINTLVNEKQNAGTYEATFDGSSFSSGVYFYRITAGSPSVDGQVYTETKKMLLVK